MSNGYPYGMPPPWWYSSQHGNDKPVSLRDQIADAADGIKALTEFKESLEKKKDKGEDKSKGMLEGLTKKEIFCILTLASPFTGLFMAYVYVQALNTMMNMAQHALK